MLKQIFKTAPILGVACLFSAGIVGAALAADPFTLTSPAFKDGELMPAAYGDIRLANEVNSCGMAAKKISPALSWANPPEKTQSFVVLMLDADAGLGASHWVAYDIAAAKRSLVEGEAAQPSGFVAGKSYRAENYSGPCPPAGPAHHYVINIYATDLAPGTLKPGLNREELLESLKGHNLATASMIGKYARAP